MNRPESRTGYPPRGWMLTDIGRRRPGSPATATAQAWSRVLYTRTSPVEKGSVTASRPGHPPVAACAGCATSSAPAPIHSAAVNTPRRAAHRPHPFRAFNTLSPIGRTY
ncbi:hypothetical protein J7F03_10920 [Streptomyces sp. ISL-43]|uniref:hypothetical protein n=1 Tax=Streptomyces sp. ISL-43 TaxID=2819183 RepID=UPI001BEC56F5|nr:hypothetical protein [Streptomyces sp. ISL-43]